MADRPAPESEEIEITAEMIEAGAEALFCFSYFDGLNDGARLAAQDVYRAMAGADPSRAEGCAGKQ